MMEKVFNCELCTEEFHSRDELNAHASEHEALPKGPRKQFKCNLCRYEASQKGGLILHMRTHTGERPFKCTSNGCEKAFKRESHLKAHKMRLHSRREAFKCSHPQCTKSFKRFFDLQSHFSHRHEKRNVPCDHPGCDKKFANVKAMREHERITHSKKSLVCPTLTCSYRTNNASNLSRHIIVHDVGKEKILCSVEGCQHKGKNTLDLKNYMCRHKTLLPCPVTGCGRYARTKKALENHIKYHNPSDRPFQCPLCFKYYPTLHQLQQHCAIHTKEKPFACGLCDYAASFRSTIKSHISCVHGSIRFPFIVHLLDERECLDCKLTLSTSGLVAGGFAGDMSTP